LHFTSLQATGHFGFGQVEAPGAAAAEIRLSKFNELSARS
jgi:hypothetical protein